MSKATRREFLTSLGAAVIAGTIPPGDRAGAEEQQPIPSSGLPYTMGMASYTFRAFPTEKVLAMTARLGLRGLTLKDMHLPLQSSESEIKAILSQISSAGLVLNSAGVVYMKTEEEIRNAFAYAKMAGLKFLVGVPEKPLLKVAEHYVKQSGIALAIHNHGPTDQQYPGPESIYSQIGDMDKRMGLCIDIGHTQRMGLDPSVDLERFFDRVLDLHIKDVTSADAGGKTVEMGRGVIDIPKFLRTLTRIRYSGTVHFEFEKDEKDPLPGVAESVGYVRGILAAM